MTSYFETHTTEQRKEKSEFRDKFSLINVASALKSKAILTDFTDRKLVIPNDNKVFDVQVHLHVKVLELDEYFKQQGYQITMQLFKSPKCPHAQPT